MSSSHSQRINITLPAGLLKQVDRLVEHDYGNRSTIIRNALLEYVRQPNHKLIADPDSVNIAKMYQELKAEHEYLDPADAELIQFLYQQRMRRQS
jgi:metal-responsive CopG/Arc/MetJ family transcriptional regulator